MIPNPESNLSDQLTKSHLHTTRDADVATLTQREGQIALRLKGAALIHSDQVDGNGATILKYRRIKLLWYASHMTLKFNNAGNIGTSCYNS